MSDSCLSLANDSAAQASFSVVKDGRLTGSDVAQRLVERHIDAPVVQQPDQRPGFSA